MGCRTFIASRLMGTVVSEQQKSRFVAQRLAKLLTCKSPAI